MKQIPNAVIGAVSAVLAAHYYSHSTLNSLLMESGAPGDVPEGNCETKCSRWLKRCNDDPSIDALAVLGRVLQNFMDAEADQLHAPAADGQKRIAASLAREQLCYQRNGYITLAGSTPAARTLADYFKANDFASIEAEFARAVQQINKDPHAAITAACAIIEAFCKTYLEASGLELPSKQTAVPLWRAVQTHLGLNQDPLLSDDQHRIIQGLASIVDGVAAFRTHIGSAHGRGVARPEITVAEARLTVNASHTIVIYLMERWSP